MDEPDGIQALHDMLVMATALAALDDPVLDEAMPRVVAIVHDALRLVDLDYLPGTVR